MIYALPKFIPCVFESCGISRQLLLSVSQGDHVPRTGPLVHSKETGHFQHFETNQRLAPRMIELT